MFDEWYETTKKGMRLIVGHYKITPEREGGYFNISVERYLLRELPPPVVYEVRAHSLRNIS